MGFYMPQPDLALLEKCYRVIGSCKNLKQLQVAQQYIKLAALTGKLRSDQVNRMHQSLAIRRRRVCSQS